MPLELTPRFSASLDGNAQSLQRMTQEAQDTELRRAAVQRKLDDGFGPDEKAYLQELSI